MPVDPVVPQVLVLSNWLPCVWHALWRSYCLPTPFFPDEQQQKFSRLLCKKRKPFCIKALFADKSQSSQSYCRINNTQPLLLNNNDWKSSKSHLWMKYESSFTVKSLCTVSRASKKQFLCYNTDWTGEISFLFFFPFSPKSRSETRDAASVNMIMNCKGNGSNDYCYGYFSRSLVVFSFRCNLSWEESLRNMAWHDMHTQSAML